MLNTGWHPGVVVTVTSLYRRIVWAVAPGASTTVCAATPVAQPAGLPSWWPLRSMAETPGKPRIAQACRLRLVNCSG